MWCDEHMREMIENKNRSPAETTYLLSKAELYAAQGPAERVELRILCRVISGDWMFSAQKGAK